ncbi:MAG: tetratricopeptide repeat protein [Anaerohalosphaeraceae bacterium]
MNKTIAGLFLISVGMFCGCQNASPRTDRINPDVIESDKAQLLRRLDRKFDDPQAHYQLGKIYQREGQLDRAAWEFTLALQFDPVHFPAQAAKVRVYRDLRQFDRMKVAAELFIEQAGGSAESLTLLGRSFQAEGLDDYALTCYQKGLARSPNSALLHKLIGIYYLNRKDYVQAEQYLRRSIQIDPYQPDVAAHLGKMGVVIQVPQPSQQQSPSAPASSRTPAAP